MGTKRDKRPKRNKKGRALKAKVAAEERAKSREEYGSRPYFPPLNPGKRVCKFRGGAFPVPC